jgi:hypothetical protein
MICFRIKNSSVRPLIDFRQGSIKKTTLVPVQTGKKRDAHSFGRVCTNGIHGAHLMTVVAELLRF